MNDRQNRTENALIDLVVVASGRSASGLGSPFYSGTGRRAKASTWRSMPGTTSWHAIVVRAG